LVLQYSVLLRLLFIKDSGLDWHIFLSKNAEKVDFESVETRNVQLKIGYSMPKLAPTLR